MSSFDLAPNRLPITRLMVSSHPFCPGRGASARAAHVAGLPLTPNTLVLAALPPCRGELVLCLFVPFFIDPASKPWWRAVVLGSLTSGRTPQWWALPVLGPPAGAPSGIRGSPSQNCARPCWGVPRRCPAGLSVPASLFQKKPPSLTSRHLRLQLTWRDQRRSSLGIVNFYRENGQRPLTEGLSPETLESALRHKDFL